MASILKVDQLQSDTGTVNLASNLAFTGAATFVGNIANPTITGTLNLTGGGIKFPAAQIASADANTLDDYEEGEWTVTDQSGAGLTISNSGPVYYRKIGSLVFVTFYITYPVNSNGTNALISLPFQAASYSYLVGRFQNIGPAVFQTNVGSSTAICYPHGNGGNAYTNAQLSGGYILLSGCYVAAS